MKIYLARHGQNEDNLNKILNGHRDKPLTKLGIKQAETVAELIKNNNIHFDIIYSSPLIRALKTAEIISNITGSSYPVKHKLLIERNFGVMTGIETKKIKKLCEPDILQSDTVTYFLNPEEAETFPELLSRAKLLLDEIIENHFNESILLVSHGDIGKMIYAAYYNLPWKEVLTQFHFGNSELLLLSEDSSANEAHIFKVKQHNHI
jgi:broad specificity phosphatase PhoE